MDFKYEMVVPNEDLPCKFFIFEGKNGNYRRANHWPMYRRNTVF